MSHEQLLELVSLDALRPRLQFHELAGDHVTFDGLTASDRYEQTVARAVVAGTVTSVVGPRGGGKTSLIAYCCAHLPDSVLALRVPVIGMNDPGDPGIVAATMITAALQAAEFEGYQRELLEAARADEITTHQNKPGARAKLGGGVIPVELQAELQSFGRDFRRDQPLERLSGLDRLLSMFTARELRPLFVIEDTEAMAGSPTSDETVTRFFAQSLHMIAREVDAPTLIAVQHELVSNAAYVELRGGMREVVVPVFEVPAAALRSIVEYRVTERASTCAAVDDIMNEEALDAFGAFYEGTGASIRHTLAAIAASVEHAAEAGADRVGGPEARYGIEQWQTRDS